MTAPCAPLEDRLRAALTAEAATTRPTGGSLPVIRARAARRRRHAVVAGLAAVAVAAGAVLAPLLGPDYDRARTGITPVNSPPSVPVPVPPPPPSGPGTPVPEGDPVAAARAFVALAVGVPDAPVSAFRPEGDGAGTVDVPAAGTHLSLRRDDQGWTVVEATALTVAIDSPPSEASLGTRLHVAGRGQGLEGTLIVRVVSTTGSVVGATTAFAGPGPEAVPYATDVSLVGSPGGAGYVVVFDGVEAGAGTVVPFAARLVELPPPTPPAVPVPAEAPPPQPVLRGVPLFPFADWAEVDQWQLSYREEGHQPWHLDAEMTAQAFAGYLGFTEIDAVTSRDVGDDEAWVGVGTADREAAVVHLLRWGTGPDAPWEVVGTRDTDLTLATPAYGSQVVSPVEVGGRITGVDENLRVRVYALGTEGPVGERCCVPAGGVESPWSTSVSFPPQGAEILTIVVSTGGHLQEVERFAVTGIRVAGTGPETGS
jgi:hypothetical protein